MKFFDWLFGRSSPAPVIPPLPYSDPADNYINAVVDSTDLETINRKRRLRGLPVLGISDVRRAQSEHTQDDGPFSGFLLSYMVGFPTSLTPGAVMGAMLHPTGPAQALEDEPRKRDNNTYVPPYIDTSYAAPERGTSSHESNHSASSYDSGGSSSYDSGGSSSSSDSGSSGGGGSSE